jgi:hypothetical protein
MAPDVVGTVLGIVVGAVGLAEAWVEGTTETTEDKIEDTIGRRPDWDVLSEAGIFEEAGLVDIGAEL